jgi:hypothetical protein
MIDCYPTIGEERLMNDQDALKTAVEPGELEEKQRRDMIRALEPYGMRPNGSSGICTKTSTSCASWSRPWPATWSAAS